MARSNSGSVQRVDGEMTIYRAGELAQQLPGRLARKPGAARIDLSEVTEIDTAGVQILLVMNRVANAAGSRLAIVNPASCVVDVLALCNLTHLLASDGTAT